MASAAPDRGGDGGARKGVLVSEDTTAAEKSLRSALALDPGNRIAQAELQKLRP